MKKLSIIGISGRMGSELLALAPEFHFEVTQGVDRTKHSLENVVCVDEVKKLEARHVDVVIDFSMPELLSEVVDWCAQNAKALVSGVTGLSAEQKVKLSHAAQATPVLWAPNMSLGIAVLSRMIREMGKLKGFDFQIEDFHHKLKKDNPSGTALFLQEKLESTIGEKVPAPLGIRGGGVFGVHRVWAMGEEETILLEHTAMNRRVFARGALAAAQWILNRQPGLYTLDDVLESPASSDANA